ncbi:MAG: hypothetical protein QMC38_13150 [Sinobacterium sp.]
MNKLNMFVITLAVIFLTNCGGGSTDKPISVDSQAPQILSTDSNTTLLSGNPKADVSSVKVFDSFPLKINLGQVAMEGEFRFLKIIDQHKKMLFLGQVKPVDIISIPLNVVSESFPLIVEIFSESEKDTTINYEVNYE